MTAWDGTVDENVGRGADYARSLNDGSQWADYVESGVLGATMPQRLGGQELSVSALVATFEGLAYGGGDPGVLFAMSAQIWTVQHAILKFGTEEQRLTYIPKMIAGTLRGAHAATEREAGSDVFGLQTRAVRCCDGYRLTGGKLYITSAPVADVALVFASTEPRGPWGISAFLVDLDAPGVRRGPGLQKMGLDGAQFGELTFDDCFVAAGTATRFGGSWYERIGVLARPRTRVHHGSPRSG